MSLDNVSRAHNLCSALNVGMSGFVLFLDLGSFNPVDHDDGDFFQ